MMLLVPLILFAVCAESYLHDEALRSHASRKLGTSPRRVVVDLDKPPQERWAFLAKDPFFANWKNDFLAYVGKSVPKAAVPLIAKLATSLRHSFYDDYAMEMVGIAKALDVDIGEIVAANLIYQLEGISEKCEDSNMTGPCPPKQNSPGLCTGIVADDGARVWEARNLDWNLDASLLKYVMQVDYRQKNQTRFTAVQIIGQIGVLHGLSQVAGFSGQLNARDKGGNVLENLAEIALGAKTPTHVLRRALEQTASFNAAFGFLSSEGLANPCYFIMAGSAAGEGAIVTRERKGLVDAWHLHEAPAKDTKSINLQPGWFRLQTNFDHWEPAPSYDDRRTPGVNNMVRECNGTVGESCLKDVITTWPTKNHHTDVTSIMCPETGFFETIVWVDPASMSIVV